MNAFLTVLPMIIIRYGLLGSIPKVALKRADFFAPLIGREKIALWIYQITNTLMLLYLLLLKIKPDSHFFYWGLIVYILGVILYAVSMKDFAAPDENGLNLNGIYKLSRNPMYIAYFIYFLGCVLLTRSWLLLVILIVFQISVHVIIVSEERWCINELGVGYIKYMDKVRRYI